MNTKEIEVFKNELKNYRYYVQKVNELKSFIDDSYDALSGVRGVDPAHIPSTFNDFLVIEARYRVYDDIDKATKQKQLLEAKISSIKAVLDRLEPRVKSIVLSIYADNLSFEQVARSLNYSKSGLYKIINNSLKNI